MSISEAAASGDIQRLRALLEAGGDPNEKETEDLWPPLLEAAYHDHAEIARLLLDVEADLYAPTENGETPLLMAVQQGSLGVFRLLLERGADTNVTDSQGDTPLEIARKRGHREVVLLLQQASPLQPSGRRMNKTAHGDGE